MTNMLEVEARGPVLYVRLNRPEVRNAFNAELIALIATTFRQLPEETRAVVLSGNGPAFCAGGDLEWMKKAASYSAEENQEDALRLAGMLEAVAHAKAFVLSRVHGPAFGGGCGLVAASDYVIASKSASFAFSEVRLGLVAATISPYAVEKIGAGQARALFMSGLAFDADRAERIGLAHAVVKEEELDAEVDRVLKAVLSAGPHAVLTSREVARGAEFHSIRNASRLANARASEEGKEGVDAFLNKRKPSFATPWPPAEEAGH
jgi:enoyl-CoA hydratase/carnithine racemase